MIDWSELTSDPLDSHTEAAVRQYLRSVSQFLPLSVLDIFVNASVGKNVLHVGCVEHHAIYVKKLKWKHRPIHAAAKRCLGVDINSDGIKLMRELGFEAVCADITSCSPLGEKFDLIVVGDVIEHLGDLQALIEFCKQHLCYDGKILISTPNPFFLGHVIRAWTGLIAPCNLEHTSWISEFNILEICRRSKLNLAGIYYACGNSSSSRVKRYLKKLAYHFGSSMLTTTLIYSLNRPKN